MSAVVIEITPLSNHWARIRQPATRVPLIPCREFSRASHRPAITCPTRTVSARRHRSGSPLDAGARIGLVGAEVAGTHRRRQVLPQRRVRLLDALEASPQ